MRKSHSRFEESVPNGWDVVWGFVPHCHSHAVRDIDVALFQLHARVGHVEDQWLNGPSGFEMLDNLVVGRSQKLALRNLIDGFRRARDGDADQEKDWAAPPSIGENCPRTYA